MRFFRLAAILYLFATPAVAQDPLKVAPQAYKLQFENEYVKVVRVHYAPREKVVAHEHTPTASAYVYLNDGGPVVFNHLDKDYGAVTRPATKAGSFRVYKAQTQHCCHQPQSTDCFAVSKTNIFETCNLIDKKWYKLALTAVPKLISISKSQNTWD